jgi:nicotinate-nucleotide adenylyltransferase
MAKHSLYNNLDKVVIIGGTFDPIHIGHLEMANHLLSIFNTKITFMPTSIPNYKEPPKANNTDRLNMLKLALDGQPDFQIDTREIEAPNYCPTYQTLSEIRSEIGYDIPLYFLIGGDSLQSLDTWDYWDKLPDITHFVVANRSGYSTNDIKSPELKLLFKNRQSSDLKELQNSGGFYMLNFTPTNISSTTIRNKVKNHEDINPYVTQSVARYIEKHHLYLS